MRFEEDLNQFSRDKKDRSFKQTQEGEASKNNDKIRSKDTLPEDFSKVKKEEQLKKPKRPILVMKLLSLT